jgi:hypothetical protein
MNVPSNPLYKADSVPEDLLANVRADCVFSTRSILHSKIFKILLNRNDVEETSPGFQANQDNDVTFIGSLSPQYGSVDAKILCPVRRGDAQNLVTVVFQDVAVICCLTPGCGILSSKTPASQAKLEVFFGNPCLGLFI